MTNEVLMIFTEYGVLGTSLFIFLGIILLLMVLISTFYRVRKNEVAIIERFGRLVKIDKPGLYMKIPFADQVVFFTSTLDNLDESLPSEPGIAINDEDSIQTVVNKLPRDRYEMANNQQLLTHFHH